MDNNTTIAAIATPLGNGAISIIRMSGERALSIASQLFRTSKLKSYLDAEPIRQYSGRNWHSVSYLSLGGLNYMALDHYLSEHPEVKKLRVCLDGDEAGRGFAAKIVSKYKEKGYEVDDCPPRMGKDYNDALCIYCARRREHRNQRE